MSVIITMPVTRALDRAIRLLQLTYRMALLHRGATVFDVLENVAGYSENGQNGDAATDSAMRKFEHDKKALRRVGIPIGVRRHDDPQGTFYKITPRDLFLPTAQADRRGWNALRQARAGLQRVADAVGMLPASDAAQLTTVLLAYREELDLTMPTWDIPRVMLTNGPLLLDWVHSTFCVAAVRGRRDREWGGEPVPLTELSAVTGLPLDLLHHAAERADAAADGREELPHAVRTTLVRNSGLSANRAPADADALSVVAPDMRATWRPPRSHVETLLQVAQDLSVPVSADAAETLRRHARAAATV